MTKLISLAVLALAATAGAALAENTFTLDRARSTDATLSLSNVQADQAGTVQVFELDGDRAVRFLGQAPVIAGANGTVEVELNQPSRARIQIAMTNGNRNVSTLNTEAPLTN